VLRPSSINASMSGPDQAVAKSVCRRSTRLRAVLAGARIVFALVLALGVSACGASKAVRADRQFLIEAAEAARESFERCRAGDEAMCQATAAQLEAMAAHGDAQETEEE
jgi:hypothetical protein